MKNYKNIFGLLTLTLLFVVSCNNDDSEIITGNEGGFLVNTTYTSGKILGNPEIGVDLLDAEIEYTDVELNFDARLEFGSQTNVERYEIVKTFSRTVEVDGEDVTTVSDEIVVATETSLPFNLVYTTIEEYLSGLSMQPEDLRVGDTFTFKTRYYYNDGSQAYFNDGLGSYNVVVNCKSDLAGTYAINYSSGLLPHFVKELSPGLYEIHSMMGWPTSTYKVTFTDTCGDLEIIDDWQFSNTISGIGYVDTNGDLVWTSVSVSGQYDGNSYRMIKQ